MNEVSDKIAQLKARYAEQLPSRIALARELAAQIAAQPGDREARVELHRILHSIKGTGHSFGFRAVGHAAEQGEALLAGSLAATDAQDFPGDLLAACFARIERAVAAPELAAAVSIERPLVSISANADGGDLVYLCDDDVIFVEQLAIQLRCFGYDARAFVTPDDLRAAMAARCPAALVLDIGFQAGCPDGTEVLADLRRELAPQIPAVFLSARGDFQARLNAVVAGGQAYFHKPARTLELVMALDKLTRRQLPEPYRVLIVDDEPAIADYHGLILEQAGMISRCINHPAEVLEVLQEFRPDILLTDMYMPACSGYQLSQVIRQFPEYVGLPIVYLSGETDKAKQVSALSVGAEGFLTKPVAPEDLITAVALRAERMRTLRSLMARDSLTGLFNHTTTTQLLANAMAGARRRQDGRVCLVMIDIDHFKSVNDRFGHPAGDQVILALARMLQQCLRASDIVGRYGGEEFAAILSDVGAAKAVELMDRLRTAFGRVVFTSASAEFSCSFSAGVAEFPCHERLEQLREAADQALYEAKRGGRNRVVASDPGPLRECAAT